MDHSRPTRGSLAHVASRDRHFDGPLIPCMAVEAIVRKSLEEVIPAPGARTATADVTLADYGKLFSRRAIYSGMRERVARARPQSLYQHTLGSAWDQLAPEIRQLHSVDGESAFTGYCTVERGRHPLAWLIATCIGFPNAGANQAISVTLIRKGDGERWIRQTETRRFSSIQNPGRGRYQWLIRERFGPVAVYMALVVEGECLRYVIRKWTLFGNPLPLSLGPRSTAVESFHEGKFQFDVDIRHALTGLIVRYQGMLAPAQPGGAW